MDAAPASVPIRVVAGVLLDGKGRALLARRTEGRDLAGLWEFPGGKHEPGEAGADALARELAEELGIQVRPSDCRSLIAVPFAYPGKRIVLAAYTVHAWTGEPRGLEAQALAWAPVEGLHAYPMPPADLPVLAALRDPPLYLITPEPVPEAHPAFIAAVESALAGGIRRIQLRARAMEEARLRRLAADLADRCRDACAELFINGRADLALKLGVGVHLRADQLRPHAGRRPLPPGLPVAASCHDADELALAAECGADFVVLGPLAPTATHPGAAGIGWAAFAALRETTALPIYALGGLGPADLVLARAHGAQGVAGISAFWPGTR